MTLVIETERLLLRDYTPDDAGGAMAIYRDPEVMHFLGGVQQRSESDTRAWLEKVCAKYDAFRARGLPYVAAAAFEKSSGELVGTALFKPLPDASGADTRELEIGWHLARRAWGHGYATEMGAAMRERAFETTDVREVHAVVDPGNTRSERVAQRLGMRFDGEHGRFYGRTLLDYTMSRGAWRDRLSSNESAGGAR